MAEASVGRSLSYFAHSICFNQTSFDTASTQKQQRRRKCERMQSVVEAATCPQKAAKEKVSNERPHYFRATGRVTFWVTTLGMFPGPSL